MASYDPDFQAVDEEKAPPGYVAEPRRRGCLFYGCIVAVVGSVLLTVGLALGMLALYRTALRYRDLYTATAPVELPKLRLSDAERRRAVERITAFRDVVADGEAREPLTLTGDDLNALIEDAPRLKDRVHLSLVDGKIKARVSFPLSELKDVSLTRGRYLNGEAEVKLELEDGSLSLEFESIVVDGKPLPEAVEDVLSQSDVILDDDDDDENDTEEERRNKRFLRRLDTIEVVDDVMIVTPKNARKPRAGSGPSSDAEPESESESEPDLPADPFAPSSPAPPLSSTP